jgi:hypothetical protein
MQAIIGLILVVLGIVLGLYFGGWVLFIGGILQFFSSLIPLNLIGIAWGLIKFLLSGLVGWGIFVFCMFIGACLIDTSK